jgi:hypothetical protein
LGIKFVYFELNHVLFLTKTSFFLPAIQIQELFNENLKTGKRISQYSKEFNNLLVFCGDIGFLPYELRHVGLNDAAPIYVQT